MDKQCKRARWIQMRQRNTLVVCETDEMRKAAIYYHSTAASSLRRFERTKPQWIALRRVGFPFASFSYTTAQRRPVARATDGPLARTCYALVLEPCGHGSYICTGVHAACKRETTSRLTSCYMLNVLNVLSFWKTMDVTIEVNCYDNELNQRTDIWWT
jgi:hypothetical protein